MPTESHYDEEEEIRVSVPPEYRDIGARYEDMSVRNLWESYMEEKLILQADFQRYYVWDSPRACRFIESLILNMPVPPIYVAENNDGTFDVVDGHQRLESVFRFLQPLASGIAAGAKVKPVFTTLTLKNLEVLGSDLNGRNVLALGDEDRRKLFDRKLSVVVIPRTADKIMKYVLFARLNLGSVALNPQELRNCIYRGPYNNVIKQIASDSRVLDFFNMRQPHKRMKDCELVLTFLALAHRSDHYRTPFRLFLNEEMEANRDCSAEAGLGYRREFLDAIEKVKAVFGKEACWLFVLGDEDDPNGHWRGRRYDQVYEIEMLSMHRNRQPIHRAEEAIQGSGGDLSTFREGLKRGLIRVMTNDQFIASISEGTKRPDNVRRRHSMADQIISVYASDPFETIRRVRQVWSRFIDNQYCTHCGTLINSFDDAVLVSRQLSEGALGHRYCAKSAGLPVLPY